MSSASASNVVVMAMPTVAHGLPPQVNGDTAGEISVAVRALSWVAGTSHPAPEATVLRLQWWGDDSDGVFFRPHGAKPLREAWFPVKCSAEYLNKYLCDAVRQQQHRTHTLTHTLEALCTADSPHSRSHFDGCRHRYGLMWWMFVMVIK